MAILQNMLIATPKPLVSAAVEALASQGGAEARGAVFTRKEVVDFILDLAGYKEDQALYQKRILEPSFGGGDFLLPIVGRLLRSWRVSGSAGDIVDGLGNSIRAVELHRATFAATRQVVIRQLEQEGISHKLATALVNCWLVQTDFLLSLPEGQFDYVVGNPPYVRQELIPYPLLIEYRSRYQTMYDRADLYIPFIESSLSLLTSKGCLAFICADRWMKNRYGGPLRKLVSRRYNLKVYVDMVNTPAFYSEVIAYPAITVISREKPGSTRIAIRPEINSDSLRVLAAELTSRQPGQEASGKVRELSCITNGSEPWILESTDQTALIRRLERQYPSIEEAGCNIGIGVATGADRAFIGDFDSLDVEPDRKLPIVTTRDIASGEVKWQGLGVINPFTDKGSLVDLRDYPRLRRYLEERKDIIAGRHIAKKNPSKWYRTIDRITPSTAHQTKLLIPDIKGDAHVVFEDGHLYPHHNLYYITSRQWDLRALQAVLLSEVAKFFVATYSTRMRGGFLRFQAQYLRRIRLPYWSDVNTDLKQELVSAATSRDLYACSEAAFRLFGLSHDERSSIGGNRFNDT